MNTVTRHTPAVRATHWAVAISGILLLFSGFGQMPMYKRYNLVKVPGFGWSSNYDITLVMHYVAAVVFGAAVLFHFVYHLRRREFDIVPRKGDLGEAVRGFLAMIGIGKEPEHGKFQAKQRVVYAVFVTVGGLLLLTGLVKSFKNLGPVVVDPMFLQWVAFTHTITGMIFMLLFLVHVMIFLVKSYRPLFPSMFTGRIDAEYARHHHPAWDSQAEESARRRDD